MALITQALCAVDNTKDSCDQYVRSADCSLQEMQNLYQERLPYVPQEKVGGLCLQWDAEFIALCRYAMSTDCMDGMSAQEKALWRNFVAYEDAMSTSADDTMCNGLAVGCTVADENGNSYAVCSDGSISSELCLDPATTFPKEYLYRSLDQHFMALVNCDDVGGCGCDEQHELIYNDCELCGPDYPTCPAYFKTKGE